MITWKKSVVGFVKRIFKMETRYPIVEGPFHSAGKLRGLSCDKGNLNTQKGYVSSVPMVS